MGPDRYFKIWEVIKLEFDLEVNHFLGWYGVIQSQLHEKIVGRVLFSPNYMEK